MHDPWADDRKRIDNHAWGQLQLDADALLVVVRAIEEFNDASRRNKISDEELIAIWAKLRTTLAALPKHLRSNT